MVGVRPVCLDADSDAAAWRDHDTKPSFLDSNQVAAFDIQGFCVVPQAIPPEVLRSLEENIDRLEHDRNRWLRERPRERSWISRADVVDFAPHLVAKSPHLRQFSLGHPMIDICRDLIGPDVRLNFDQAVYKRAFTPAATLPLHQDNGYNFKRPEAYITIWMAFQDVDTDNGCLWIVPGVHRHGTLEHHVSDDGFFVCDIDPEDAVAVPTRAGDLVVLSSLAPHATAGNHSGRIRKTYLLSYVADHTCVRDGTPCNAPETQYQVLQNGRPATPLEP